MKNVFWAMCVVASVSFLAWNTPAYAEAETKKVCKEKTDKTGKPVLDKAGKPQEECKTSNNGYNKLFHLISLVGANFSLAVNPNPAITINIIESNSF